MLRGRDACFAKRTMGPRGENEQSTRAPESTPARLVSLQEQMGLLAAEVARVDLRKFRTLSADRAWQQIVARATLPIAARLTARAREIVAEVTAACASHANGSRVRTSSLPPAFLSFELTMDSAVRGLDAKGASRHTVEDLAFLVQIELRQRAERLGRLDESSEPLSVIGECDSALRRVRKGLTAIDAAIAAAEHVPPTLVFAEELRDSLRVRRAYARVRSYFLEREREHPDATEANLRGAAARIDSLCEGDCAELLRVRDRLQILEIRDRLRAFLGSPRAQDRVEGGRVWQDVLGFVEMLALVRRRQELVEHDARTVTALLSALHDGASHDEALPLARALEGCDDEWDHALAHVHDPALLMAAAVRLSKKLGVDT